MESGVSEWMIERACKKLILQYAEFIDSGEAARVADLFTLDGVWEAYANRKVGQSEIRKAFYWRQRHTKRVSRHLCTNIAIEVLGPTEAAGHTYFALFREEPGSRTEFVPFSGPKMVGDYIDRFVLTGDGWRFAQRRVIVAFKIAGLQMLGEVPSSHASPQAPSDDMEDDTNDT